MQDQDRRLQFLWDAAHTYAASCPTLSASLMDTFHRSCPEGLCDTVKQRFCPCCGGLFTPLSSRGRFIRRKRLCSKRRRCQLRCRRDIEWLYRPSCKRASFLIHCRSCRRSLLVPTVPSRTATLTPRQGSKVTPTILSTSAKKSSRRRSLTLKSILASRNCLPRPPPSSPSLSQFLTMTV